MFRWWRKKTEISFCYDHWMEMQGIDNYNSPLFEGCALPSANIVGRNRRGTPLCVRRYLWPQKTRGKLTAPLPPYFKYIIPGAEGGGGGWKEGRKWRERMERCYPGDPWWDIPPLAPWDQTYTTHLYLCRRGQSKGIEVGNTKIVCCTFQFTHQIPELKYQERPILFRCHWATIPLPQATHS